MTQSQLLRLSGTCQLLSDHRTVTHDAMHTARSGSSELTQRAQVVLDWHQHLRRPYYPTLEHDCKKQSRHRGHDQMLANSMQYKVVKVSWIARYFPFVWVSAKFSSSSKNVGQKSNVVDSVRILTPPHRLSSGQHHNLRVLSLSLEGM